MSHGAPGAAGQRQPLSARTPPPTLSTTHRVGTTRGGRRGQAGTDVTYRSHRTAAREKKSLDMGRTIAGALLWSRLIRGARSTRLLGSAGLLSWQPTSLIVHNITNHRAVPMARIASKFKIGRGCCRLNWAEKHLTCGLNSDIIMTNNSSDVNNCSRPQAPEKYPYLAPEVTHPPETIFGLDSPPWLQIEAILARLRLFQWQAFICRRKEVQ